MTLSDHVRTLGRGPGRSRSLTRDEACDAMRHMLSQDADQAATGALLMLLRMKGETAEEIAGLTEAVQQSLPDMPFVHLDWPSYAAGRTRGLPWFLLSARLVAAAGYRVMLHGWNGPDASVRNGLANAGIPIARTKADIAEVLDAGGIVYAPQETLMPSLFALLSLRDKLGLRSCINTVSRMANPARAAASVQGVFHPSYRLLQADAAHLMGWQSLSVIKGGGGEFERNPAKSIEAFGLRNGAVWQDMLPPARDEKRRLSDGPAPQGGLRALWNGCNTDPFATAIVIGTAETALATLGAAKPHELAQTLWAERARERNAHKELVS